MSYSTVTRKGQVTIPKVMRDALGLELGDRVAFRRRGLELVVKPVKRSILDLEGVVEPRQRPEDFQQVRATVLRSRVRARAQT